MQNKSIIYISRVIFFIYIFFTTYGTTLPFRERNWDPSEIATSNIFNQIIFTPIFLISLLLIINKRSDFYYFIKTEKFLLIFVLWCTISIGWSDYPFISFKRLIQFYTSITVAVSFFLYNEDLSFAFKTFTFVWGSFLILSLISVFTIPTAIDQAAEGWRGLAPQKNHLGQITLYSIITWWYLYKKTNNLTKLIFLFLLIITLILLIGGKSTTTYLTLFYIIAINLAFSLDKIFRLLGIRKIISTIIILTIVTCCFLVFIFYSEYLEVLFSSFGKDLTFTGRTQLWSDILKGSNLLIGYGYQGYWVLDSPRILLLYTIYNWLPNMGHSGYVDILNETGIVGLLLVVLVLLNYFITLIKKRIQSLGTWIIIGAIITNFTETIMFRGPILGGVLFIFYYTYLFFFSIGRKEKSDYD